LQGIGWSVAKNMLAQIVNETLGWATTGGIYGLPLFINNPSLYIQNLTNEQINKFLVKQNSHPIFGYTIQSLVMLSHTGVNDGRINRLLDNNKATVGYRNFQQTFTNGGWNSFMNMGYNPIGAVFNAGDRLGRGVSGAQQNAINEKIAGNGFTDVKTCKKWNTPNSKSLAFTKDEKTGKYVGGLTTADGQPTCAEWETTTPGAIVSSQVAYSTQSTQRQLEIADNYNEVLGAYFDSLLNNLFSKGLKPVSGGSFVGSQYGNETSLGDLFGDSGGGLFGNVTSGAGGYAGEFDISKPQHTKSILKAQIDYLNASTDAYIAMRHIVPVLGALDYCIPGPNPTWPYSIGENYQTIISSITDKQDPSWWKSTTDSWVDFNNTVDILGGGMIVGWLTDLFGGKSDYYFYSYPTIFDKTRESYTKGVIPISMKYADRENKPSLQSVVNGLDNGYMALRTYLQTLYAKDNMIIAFTKAQQTTTVDTSTVNYYDIYGGTTGTYDPETGSYDYTSYYNYQTYDTSTDTYVWNYGPYEYTPPVTPTSNYAVVQQTSTFDRGKIGDMIDTTAKLIGYNQSINEIIPQYEESIIKTQNVVDELAEINYEAQRIVKVAKARYLAESKASGKPIKDYKDKSGVTHSCLDINYTIDEKCTSDKDLNRNGIIDGKECVVGQPREESDATDQMLLESLRSNVFFYKNLMK
jgi:hypothetical protein